MPLSDAPSVRTVTALVLMLPGSARRRTAPGLTVMEPLPNGVPVRVRLPRTLVASLTVVPLTTEPPE